MFYVRKNEVLSLFIMTKEKVKVFYERTSNSLSQKTFFSFFIFRFFFFFLFYLLRRNAEEQFFYDIMKTDDLRLRFKAVMFIEFSKSIKFISKLIAE